MMRSTYLAVYEFRNNHRDEYLLSIIFDRLYIPRLIKGLLP